MRLLIFKVNQLGDNVVFLPVAQGLEKLLPGMEIALFTSPLAAPLYTHCAPRLRLLAAPTNAFNGAWKNPAALLRLRRQVRGFKPDACLVANDQGNVAHLLAWMSGARIRVGPGASNCKLRGLLTHRVPLHLPDPIALQNWRIAQATLDALGVKRAAMPDHPPPPDVNALRAPPSAEPQTVLIHPGASRAYQRWPMERFVILANRLCERVPVLFIRQNHAAEDLLDARVRLTATDSLAGFFALMSRAAFFIGNNSGPMHIASALGVPGLVFTGPSADHWKPMWHPEKFTLLRDPALACQPCDKLTGPVNHCANEAEPMACMNRVSVDAAHRVVMERTGLK